MSASTPMGTPLGANRRGYARAALALSISMALSACAAQMQSGDSPFGGDTVPNFVTLEVDNLNFNQARIYTLRDGARSHLGVVGGKETQSFRIPWSFDQEMRVQIDLLAGGSCTTEPLSVRPGDILSLQISSVFSSSVCRG